MLDNLLLMISFILTATGDLPMSFAAATISGFVLEALLNGILQ